MYGLKLITMTVQIQINSLEAQLLEEPLVLTGLVFLFEGLTDGLFDFLFRSGILDSFNGDIREFNVQRVTSGHDVIVVDDLDERLNMRTTSNTLRAHRFVNLQRGLFNSNDQSTSKIFIQ